MHCIAVCRLRLTVCLSFLCASQKKDQLKLVHLPSHSAFTNWPTDKTPFNRVQCLDFSPGGGYLAVGNNRGKVLLYQLNHFGSA